MEKSVEEKQHKRRVRYSGKYPKKFEEKYKEHNPEKYKDVVEHVIAKGSTPAGMHISIMVKEILDFLQIEPGQQGLDCTLGYGGHTSKMLEKLQGEGCIYGLDVDPIESKKTVDRLRNAGYGDDIFKFRLINFENIDKVCEEAGKFDFVLADLGVSSMQIDNPERGFSYKIDGPLDLRLNPDSGESAAERLHNITKEEFVGMLVENSDEPYAEEIAEKVFSLMKKGNPMDTEFEVLYSFLDKLPAILKDGGRVAILTFHSGEDRLVKKSFKELKKAGVYKEISEDVIRPSAEECRINPRSKSTKMRWAIKN